MADVTQITKIVPIITCEVNFCQNVCDLVFGGVDVLDLNLGVQINSVTQQVKSNSVDSGYVSHCWTSAFDVHFNHRFIVLKMSSRRIRVRRIIINITQFKIVVMNRKVWFGVCLFDVVLPDESPRS